MTPDRDAEIGDLLRRELVAEAESIAPAADGLEQYMREHLQRSLQLGGMAQQRLTDLENCRRRLDSLAILRHNFGPTRPDRDTIRQRTRQIRVAANAVAGVTGAVAFLCKQPPEPATITAALRDIEAATRTLTEAVKAAKI